MFGPFKAILKPKDRGYKKKAREALNHLENKILPLSFPIVEKDMAKIFLSLPTEWAEYMPGKEGKLLELPGMPGTLFACNIKKGDKWPLHFHKSNEWIWILGGEIQTISHGQKILRPGDSILFEENEPHGIVALKDSLYLVYWLPPID